MCMQSKKKKLLKFQFLGFIFLMVLFSISHAQEFPTRAIDLVVPYAPGGGVDTFFRHVRENLAKEFNVPLNIVNRTGGGGMVGSSFVINSKPDGYTLLGQDLMSLLMPQIVTPKAVPFDALKDVTPISCFAYEPSLLVIRPDLEFKTVEELISFAKKNPGKLVAGTSGTATQNRINLEILKMFTGVNIRFVSFSGGGEVLVNLLGGHVDLSTSTLSACRAHVKAGKLRALAALSPTRIAEFPELPTAKEKRISDADINMEYCLTGPRGLPQGVTDKISNTVNKVLRSPEVVDILSRRGYVINFMSPNQLSARITKDFAFFSDVAKKAGLIQE